MSRNPVKRLVIGAVIGLGGLMLAPPPALADTPLPTPTNVVAQHVSDTSADLSWLGSGLSSGDVVQREVNGTWQRYAGGLFGFLALTNLTPATTYRLRVFSVAVAGLGYTTSAASAPVSFTTLAAPDAIAPAKPSAPTFSGLTTTVAVVFWPATTDNVEVTGYVLQQLTAAGWSTLRTVGPSGSDRFQTVSGLTANTSYTFAVAAFDARGNTSARSDPGTVSTLANTATPTCRVQVITYNPGFQATVTIVNTTTATLNGWTVRFTLPASANVTSTFNGALTRESTNATFTPLAYDTVIGQGWQAYPGLVGSASPFSPPSDFTLNGLPCASA